MVTFALGLPRNRTALEVHLVRALGINIMRQIHARHASQRLSSLESRNSIFCSLPWPFNVNVMFLKSGMSLGRGGPTLIV